MRSINADVESMVRAIPRGLAIRGVVAIVFGVVILLYPDITLSVLTLLIGAFAAFDGVASLAFALAPMPTAPRLLLVLNGIAGLVVAAVTVINTSITELALLYLIGAWAIVVGVIQFMIAFGSPLPTGYRIASFVYGIASVVFGAIVFIRPGTGALALVTLIAAYAIVTGVALLGAAWEFQRAMGEIRDEVGAPAA
jgi:uncharacterized membrane protein HdeD (DUF308 family)